MSSVKVLVIDDDADSRELLGIILEAEGYAVVYATNGAEALAVGRHHRPDVILLDMAMPVMDGFAFRAEQRRDPALGRIPVICVSGRHDADQIACDLDLSGCLSKPFSLAEVVMRVGIIAGTSV